MASSCPTQTKRIATTTTTKMKKTEMRVEKNSRLLQDLRRAASLPSAFEVQETWFQDASVYCATHSLAVVVHRVDHVALATLAAA